MIMIMLWIGSFVKLRILKPGSDAHFARLIDISWTGPAATKPIITSELFLVQDYEPDD